MAEAFEKIYAVVRQIPAGRVCTYGQVALLAGNPRWARVVGYALNVCRDRSVPCHRVVNRMGGLSDAFAPQGKESHRLRLELEGVSFRPDGTVALERALWRGGGAEDHSITGRT